MSIKQPPPKSLSNQRKLTRVPCCLRVTSNEASASLGDLRNLTLDGGFVRTETPLPAGAVLPLMFKPEGSDKHIHAEAEVVRLENDGMAVRFLKMSAADSRRLRRYIVELVDAVGARENAQRLLDTESRVIKPLTDAEAIKRLLSESDGVFYIFPSSRAVRLRAKAETTTTSALTLQCEGQITLDPDEPVVCVYSHNFSSFSFRSQVKQSSKGRIVLNAPTEVAYSERRTRQRTPSTAPAQISLQLPWVQTGVETSFTVWDQTEHGLSFRVEGEADGFKVGAALPEMILVRDGQTTTISDVVVRHLTPMLENDGSTWCRVGVSCNVRREAHDEATETLDLVEEQSKVVARLTAVGRDLTAKLSFLYHSKKAKFRRAQGERGHTLVGITRPDGMQMAALLDTTFDAGGDQVRAPLLIVVPGFGSRKETMSALANTVVDTWRRRSRDIAVLRFDGTNNLGESSKDAGCEAEGKHNLQFTIPGAVKDLSAVLRWAKNNKCVSPTSIVLFSISMGSAAARRALTLPEAADVRHWISFMGAADVANAILHGSGNIDIVGNYERGIKTGVIAVIGCLIDADHFCQVSGGESLLTLPDARADMGKIRADVTWFIGKHDAYMDPKRVRDLMSVPALGKRNVIEVNAGHVPRHGEEALAEFALITKRLWAIFYGAKIDVAVPSRGWLAACEKREWDRVRKGMQTEAVSWWRDYLVGDNGIGFDAWSYTPEYQQLIKDQTELVRAAQPRRVLDLGAGTGNMTESLLKAGTEKVVAVDLVGEALEKLREKADRDDSLETVTSTADGGPLVAIRRWVNGELGDLNMLAPRLDPLLKKPLAQIASHYTPQVHALMRGSKLNALHVSRQAGLTDEVTPVLSGMSSVARFVRGLPVEQGGESVGQEAVFTQAVKLGAGLPFSNESFDGIVCSLVLSYMQHPDDTLSEIFRVLKPGGRLTISSMLPDMDSSKAFVNAVTYVEKASQKDLPGNLDRETLLTALREFADKSSKLVHLEEEGSFTFFSADQLEAMLVTTGFEDVQTRMSCGDPALAVIATGTKH